MEVFVLIYIRNMEGLWNLNATVIHILVQQQRRKKRKWSLPFWDSSFPRLERTFMIILSFTLQPKNVNKKTLNLLVSSSKVFLKLPRLVRTLLITSNSYSSNRTKNKQQTQDLKRCNSKIWERQLENNELNVCKEKQNKRCLTLFGSILETCFMEPGP